MHCRWRGRCDPQRCRLGGLSGAQIVPPLQFRSIVNAHFKFPAPLGVPAILGVIGGTAEWIFSFADRISVTVSAADAVVDKDRDELAESLWADVASALDIPAALPRWQLSRKKRATFAATPAQDAYVNRQNPLAQFLPWPATGPIPGLPACIERSTVELETAAALALRHLSLWSPTHEPAFARAIRPSGRQHRAATRCDSGPTAGRMTQVELEADIPIPAVYVLLVHYLAETRIWNRAKNPASICGASRSAVAGRFIMAGRVRYLCTGENFFALKMSR